MRRRLRVLACAAVVLATGCKDSEVQVVRIVVEPLNVTLLVGPGGGQTVQLTAIAFDSKDQVVEGRTVAWSVLGPPHVSVSPSGAVTALQVGTTVVQALVGGRSGTRIVTVEPVPVASIDLAPTTVALTVSPLGAETVALTATPRDSTGAALTGRTVTWTSSNAAVATVANGTVTAVGGGSASISASIGGVSASVTVTVTATTELPAGVDMAVADAQWTQAAQNADGTIPILRNGRAAVVNVTTLSNAHVTAPIEFVLRLFTAGGALYRSDTAKVPVPSGVTSLAAPTAQFLVPASALQEGMRWEVWRDPRNQAQDANPANDRFPAGGSVTLGVVTPPVLKLRFIPIVLSSHGNATGNVSAANIEQYLTLVRRFMPQGAIEATLGAPFATAANYGTAPQGATATFWTTLLPQLDAARVADPTHSDAHWVGVVGPPAGYTNAANGGWGYIPNSGTATGPGTRTFALVNVGWFSNQNLSMELVAHELGHNLGRFHAPCGGAGGPDPAFPNAGGVVGANAHHTHNWELGIATGAPAIPPATGDVMGYCTGVWISAYNYGAMQAFRGAAAAALQTPVPRVRTLLVQGEVSPAGTTLLTPSRITTRASGDDPMGDWTVELLDAEDGVIHRQRFALGRWDHSDERRPFAVAVVLPPAAESRLAGVRVVGPAGEARIRADH